MSEFMLVFIGGILVLIILDLFKMLKNVDKKKKRKSSMLYPIDMEYDFLINKIIDTAKPIKNKSHTIEFELPNGKNIEIWRVNKFYGYGSKVYIGSVAVMENVSPTKETLDRLYEIEMSLSKYVEPNSIDLLREYLK